MFKVGDQVRFENNEHVDVVTEVEEQEHPHYGHVKKIHCGNFSAFEWRFSEVQEEKTCPRCGQVMEQDCDGDWTCAECLYVG